MVSVFSKSGLRNWFKYYLVVILVSLGVACLGCLLVLAPLSLATTTDLNPWYVAAPVALFLLIVFGGSILAGVLIVGGRNRRLDRALTPLGLAGKAHSLSMRQYSGSQRGREVGVFFRRSPALEFSLSTTLQTRLGITTADTLAQGFRELVAQPPETPQNPTLQKLRYYPLDAAWARQVFQDVHVPAALQRLLLTPSPFDRTELVLSPGVLRLYVIGNPSLFSIPLSPQQAREWLEALLELAESLESLPAPLVTAAPTELEKTAASFRKVNWVLIVLGFMALMVVCILGSGLGIAGLLIWLRP